MASANADSPEVAAIDRLAFAVADGSHRLVGPKRILEALHSKTELHSKTRSVILRAYNRAAQEGNLHLKLRAYIKVVGHNCEITSTIIQGTRVITVPLVWFDNLNKVRAAALLGENLNDAKVAQIIAETGRYLTDIPFVPLCFDHTHGGGSGIAAVLRQLIERNQICLCVSDSDRKCPGGEIGNTAASVSPFSDHSTYCLANVIITHGRDLENCLPNSFFLARYPEHSQYGGMTRALTRFSQLEEHECRWYLDIEKGFSFRRIFSNADAMEYEFWFGKLEAFRKLPVPVWNEQCEVDRNCKVNALHSCQCVLIAGNGRDILSDFVSDYNHTIKSMIVSWLDDSVKSEWIRFAHELYGWGCADDRLRH